MVAIRDGAEGLVDALDKFGEIEGELAGGVGGAGVGNDHGMGGDVGGESGVAGLILRFVVVKPIDDRVAGGARFGVVGWKEDAVGARASHDLAAVGLLLDQGSGEGRGLSHRSHGNQDEEKAHT